MQGRSAGPVPRRASRARWRRAGAIVAASVGLALLSAACGGGAHDAVAHVGKSTVTTGPGTGAPGSGAPGAGTPVAEPSAPGPNYQKAVQYSQCMRKNGEPHFPDPNGQGDFLIGGSSGVDPSSPAFAAAQKDCKALAPPAPSTGQASKFLAEALKFSQCMQTHGVPNFPDPSDKGGNVSLTIGAGNGLDPHSPQFQKAMQACHSLLPGGGPGGP
jgi:hypothetical protein